ncbi:MAG: mucoidy inhibitor MuiA family protein [Tepidisphaera sp.]|nr:mucoidy inhibitor MuiA family protein [Tepidisphaera sp.]
MNPRSLHACALLCSTSLCALALGAGDAVRGKIENVTVYRGQALVTRLVDVPKGQGVRELVVTDLPPSILPDSLQAEAGPGTQVRSVSFRARPVGQDTREEVRTLDAKIEDLTSKLAANKRHMDVVADDRAYLQSLQGFVAPTATTELSKGVLNADTIEKLSAYIGATRATLVERELTLQTEAKSLAVALEQAQRERNELTAGASKTVFEAVVLLAGDEKPGEPLKLRYLVDNASWEPSYTLRAEGARDAMQVQYFASIRQMSGEDWGDVSMTLSTATPSLVAAPPLLTPLSITLASAPAQSVASYDDARRELFTLQRKSERDRAMNAPAAPAVLGQEAYADGRLTQGAESKDLADKSLNTVASQIQVLDILAAGRVDRARKPVPVTDEGLSVTYAVPGRASLPSRSDQQMVEISSTKVAATFTKIAMPVLTQYVYDQAIGLNTSGSVLLAGPTTSYADGAFVGGGSLPTTSAGEGITAGFGIDSSLRTRRELVGRTESVQGGNRVIEMTYRLTLENFGSKPAPVRLLDRLPKADAGRSDVTVKLVRSTLEPSSDADYLATQSKDGILRWDLAVPAAAAGRQATIVEYTFRLEYDRQLTLTGLGG